jgi:hypothetical protein
MKYAKALDVTGRNSKGGDSMSRLQNMTGGPRCGCRPPRRRYDRLGMHAIAIALLAMMIVIAGPTGPRHTTAQTTGRSLVDLAPGEVRSEAEINGSPELVWKVLTDLALYSVWNPFLSPVEGVLRPGSPLHVTMHIGTHLATYEATVLQVERNRLLSWSGQVVSPGVYDATYSFSIEPVRDGRVRLVSREARRGLAPLVEWWLSSEIQGGLDAMTRSARNRVELLGMTGHPWWRAISFSTK